MLTISKFFENLNRVEYVITNDCTGKCKHCSEGEHPYTGIHIQKEDALKVLSELKSEYDIQSVMTFGGEPLLYPDIVCAIHLLAKELDIPKRQLITNGYFSKDKAKICSVAQKISESGINDLLLSVDAFHQETIPLEPVKLFATELKCRGVNIRTSPAWLVSREHLNLYNSKTMEIVSGFKNIGIDEASGNIIFPSGNALKNLGEYFDSYGAPVNPYEENPFDVRAISFEADGTLFGKSIYTQNVSDILKNYTPEENE